MSTFAKIAGDQAIGFLLGLFVIYIVQPTTPGGTLLLILVSIASVNVIMQAVRFIFGSPKDTPPQVEEGD
jgi:hypothetical protein